MRSFDSRDEIEKRNRIELDQLFRTKANLPCAVIGLGQGAAEGDLLQQGR
jgi:hypothetical protein